MLDLSQARLTTLAVHKVGNKIKEEGIVKSKDLFDFDEDMGQLLEDYFLKPFKAEEFFKFAHDTDINLKEVYTFCKNIFEDSRENFLEPSVALLQHLYSVSMHPHIKSGEFYVAHFRECMVEDTPLEAIGLFKSENKDIFLGGVTREQHNSAGRLVKICAFAALLARNDQLNFVLSKWSSTWGSGYVE